MSPDPTPATIDAGITSEPVAVSVPDGAEPESGQHDPIDEVLVEEISIDGMCGVY